MSKRRMVGRLFIFHLVLLFLVVALAAPLTYGKTGPRSDRWTSIDSENFHIVTDAGSSTAVRIAQRLEALREILEKQGYAVAESSSAPTTIAVFRRSSDVKRYGARLLPQAVPCIGFALPQAWGNFVAVDGRAPHEDVLDSVFRGYVQLVLSYSPTYRPPWFRTGVSEYYRTFALQGGTASFGERIEEYILVLRTRRDFPIQKLLSIQPADLAEMSAADKDLFAAQSWALVHYLLASGGERKTRARAYLQAQADGQSPENAYRASFDVSYEELGKALEEYVDRRRMLFQQMKLAEGSIKPAISKTRLGQADLLAELGWLLATQTGVMEQEAEQHFRGALDLQAGHAEALAGLAMLRDRQGRGVEAEGLYQQAVSSNPESFRPYYLYARHLQQEWSVFRKEESAPWCRIRELLAEAITRRPEFFPAHLALGASYLEKNDGDAQAGIEAFARAIELRPYRSDLRLGLALLHLQVGDGDAAQLQLAELKSWGGHSRPADQVHQALDARDLGQARELLVLGGLIGFGEDLNPAIAIARTPDPDLSFENPIRPNIGVSVPRGR